MSRILLVILLLVVLAGCTRQPLPAPPPRPPQPRPAQGMKVRIPGGTIVIPDVSGHKLWEASADVVSWDGDTNTARMENVVCNFVEGGKPTLSAKAPLVTAYLDQRRVLLERGVTGRSNVEQASFTADRVEWRAADKKVYVTGNVKFTRGRSRMTGPRMVADLALRQVRMEHAQMEVVE